MSAATAIDTLLDRTIAPGYGNLGLLARRHLPGWPADPPRMDGQVALVTGAGGGIGLATCVGFARLGAGVRAVGRTHDRARTAVDAILRQVPGADVRPVACDISSLGAIKAFAERFIAEEPRLDVVVNNAGVMPAQRSRSADGHELTFASHVLAPFALTALLRDLLVGSAPARIINVSSGGMYSQQIPAGDLQSEHSEYSPKTFYARSKREEVTITEQWAQRLTGTGVVVHAMHPGWVDTQGVRSAMPVFRIVTRPILRTAAQGADTIVWLGAAPAALESTGLFWADRRPRPTHYVVGAAEDPPAVRQELWDACVAMLADAGISVD